jgi:ribonucleoside-diphosphate reductase alpha chain
MDAFGTAISLCLQYGVPVRELCRKFAHSRFEPSGFTKNPDIPMAKSLVDYIFRWLNHTFPNGTIEGMAPESELNNEGFENMPSSVSAKPETASFAEGSHSETASETVVAEVKRIDDQFKGFMEDAPACDLCGAITVRNGACYRCYNCGNSMGCS